MKSIIIAFVITSIGIGFSALSYKNQVFSDSILPCCDNGMCEYFYCDKSCCADFYEPDGCGVNSLVVSCRTCVDWTFSNCMCENTGSEHCVENDGTFY